MLTGQPNRRTGGGIRSAVDERALGLLDTLGRALLWGAVAVIGLGVISAIAIASSESSLPGLDELQRENRGIVSVISLAAGLTGAGVLAGLGGILRLLVGPAVAPRRASRARNRSSSASRRAG